MNRVVFTFIALIISGPLLALSVDELLKSQNVFREDAHQAIVSLYKRNADLLVVEFAIKRNITKIESDSEYYIKLTMLDKKSLVPISDLSTREEMEKLGLKALEIIRYDAYFEIPKGELKPHLISISSESRVLNNKWAELLP